MNVGKIPVRKRILRLSKYHNNFAPLIGLHLPSIKVRVLLRKLSFLAKLLERNDQSISARVLRTLSVDNMYDISLIDQCNTLLNDLGISTILQQCLTEPSKALTTVKCEKKRILELDWTST